MLPSLKQRVCDMIEKFAPMVQRALTENPQCEAGLMHQNRVLTTQRGPSGGPELLALVHADSRYADQYWYAHIKRRHDAQGYFSLLVSCEKLVNATSSDLLFRRYHHWTEVDPKILPTVVQRSDDAFMETSCLVDAAFALVEIISRFDLQKRSGWEGSGHEHDEADLRILCAYNVFDIISAEETPPLPPIAPKLALVKSCTS